jgi:hypothetical protein
LVKGQFYKEIEPQYNYSNVTDDALLMELVYVNSSWQLLKTFDISMNVWIKAGEGLSSNIFAKDIQPISQNLLRIYNDLISQQSTAQKIHFANINIIRNLIKTTLADILQKETLEDKALSSLFELVKTTNNYAIGSVFTDNDLLVINTFKQVLDNFKQNKNQHFIESINFVDNNIKLTLNQNIAIEESENITNLYFKFYQIDFSQDFQVPVKFKNQATFESFENKYTRKDGIYWLRFNQDIGILSISKEMFKIKTTNKPSKAKLLLKKIDNKFANGLLLKSFSCFKKAIKNV